MAREEPVSTMSLEEMAATIDAETRRHRGVQSESTIRKRSGESLITRNDASQSWARIEFGIEVFVLRIDKGFEFVAFEDTAQGQAETLTQFTKAACIYLDDNYLIRHERSILGRKRDVVIVRLESGEEISLRSR